MGKKQQKQQKQSKKFEIFISGIPYECNQTQLSSFLDSTDIINIKMPKYQDSGHSLGYAHVQVSSKQAYQNILAKNGNYLESRYLTIAPAKGQKKKNQVVNIPVGCKILFVKNLPYQITEQQIKNQFKSCGTIKDIRMVRNWINKKFKGFAYIDYKETAGVKKAVKKFHNKRFKGRILICDGVVKGMKKGFKKRQPKKKQE